MKKALAIILSLVLMLSMLAGCTSQQSEAPAPEPTDPGNLSNVYQQDVVAENDTTEEADRYGGTFKMNYSSPTNSLDPAQFYTNQNTTPGYHIFEGPVVLDDKGQVWPCVCYYEVSEDGKDITFKVREGVKFHNGDTVDVYDVVASIERSIIWSSKMQANFGDYIVDYETPDDMTVIYHLSEMAPLALIMMGDITSVCKIMPKEIVDKMGPEGLITEDADIIGTGPYKLGKWERDVSVQLDRFEDYEPFESGGTGPAAPKKGYFDSIFINVAGDSLTRTTGMIAGEYNYTTGTVADMTPDLEAAGCWVSINWNCWSPTIMFNLSEENKDSIVQNVDFRRAVWAAMDFYAYRAVCPRAPEYYKVDSCIVPDTSVYYNDILPRDNSQYNLDLAKEYLEKSGYNGETITWICSESDSYYSMSLPCSQMLQAIGVNVDLQVHESATYEQEYVTPSSEWDICARENQKPTVNPMLSDRYVSGNITGWWESEARTAALKKLSTTAAGSPESVAAFKEFCEAVKDEVPYIICLEFGTPCWYSNNIVPVRSGINVYWWNSYFKPE